VKTTEANLDFVLRHFDPWL